MLFAPGWINLQWRRQLDEDEGSMLNTSSCFHNKVTHVHTCWWNDLSVIGWSRVFATRATNGSFHKQRGKANTKSRKLCLCFKLIPRLFGAAAFSCCRSPQALSKTHIYAAAAKTELQSLRPPTRQGVASGRSRKVSAFVRARDGCVYATGRGHVKRTGVYRNRKTNESTQYKATGVALIWKVLQGKKTAIHLSQTASEAHLYQKLNIAHINTITRSGSNIHICYPRGTSVRFKSLRRSITQKLWMQPVKKGHSNMPWYF